MSLLFKDKQKQEKKGLFNCFNCSIFLLVLITVLVCYVLAQTAKTGLVEISFFSKFFYKEPSPVRLVSAQNLDFDSLLKDSLAVNQSNDFSLEVSEKQATFLINDFFVGSRFDIKKAQIAFEKNNSQAFIYLNKPSNTAVQANFDVFLNEDKEIDFLIKDIRVGNLILPKFFNGFISALAKNRIEKEKTSLQKNFKINIKDLSIENKKAKLNFSFN